VDTQAARATNVAQKARKANKMHKLYKKAEENGNTRGGFKPLQSSDEGGQC
jgi:hypothetical protein